MLDTIPFMPFRYEAAKSYIRGFYPIGSRILRFFPALGKDLELINSKITAKDYISGALFSFTFYFVFLFAFITLAAYQFSPDMLDDAGTRAQLVFISFSLPTLMFFFTMILPHWFLSKKTRDVEKSLLFATRHLMIQTSAGVPLFDAIVSVSERHEDEKLDYGEVSEEFDKIVVEVRTGKDLTTALEDSAVRNSSLYYRQLIWQLANANRSGADMGDVLRNLVEYLSEEQRIMIRDYGSQLNPLALFYMMVCIIAPTMGLVFLMVASTFVQLELTDLSFVAITLVLVVMQIMFIGLIKSRRPRVAI